MSDPRRPRRAGGHYAPRPARFAPALLVLATLAPAGAADDPPPTFLLTTAEGKEHRGRLDRLDAAGSVRLANGDRLTTLQAGGWLGLRRDGARLPPYPTGEQVILAGGDRIPLAPGSMLLAARERLFFRPAVPLRARPVELSPPLAHVALIWLAAPDGTEDPARLLRKLLSEARTRDVVLLRDGDRVEGSVQSLDRASACRVRAGKREIEVPFARVAAIAFRTDLLARPAPAGTYAHLVLDNGCRVALLGATGDFRAPRLEGKTLFGEAVTVDLGGVASLEIRGGPAVYLSDLKPTRYEHTPYLGVSWPYALDGTTAGRDLLLGGNAFDKGVGLHSSSRLTYDLGGRYSRFEALAGLDAREGRRGRARLAVLLDGKPCPCGLPAETSASDDPVPVRIDVRGARELTLVVDFGRSGDVQAHAQWAGARLVK